MHTADIDECLREIPEVTAVERIYEQCFLANRPAVTSSEDVIDLILAGTTAARRTAYAS